MGWMGSLLTGVGTALQVSSAVITICAMKMVGTGMKPLGKYINKKYAQGNKGKADGSAEDAESEKLMNKMDRIYESFCSMTQDADKMNELFGDFVDNMKTGNVSFDGLHQEGKKVNLIMLQNNVKSIVRSFEELMTTSNEILQTIDDAQNRFNSY